MRARRPLTSLLAVKTQRSRLGSALMTTLVSLGGALLLLAAIELALGIVPISHHFVVGQVQKDMPTWMVADPNLTVTLGTMGEARNPTDRTAQQAALDLWDAFEQDLEFHDRLKPNLHRRVFNFFSRASIERGETWTLDTNALGYRGRELTVPKVPGVTRVVCLGGSTTYGWGVEPNETFASFLQNLLDQRVPGKFAVFNLGSPGYTSFQGRLLMERMIAYRPDVVVCNFGNNDQGRVALEEKEIYRRHHTIPGRLALSLSRFRLFQLLQAVSLHFSRPYRHVDERRLRARVSREDYRENLRYITDIAKGIGCSVYFLVLGREASADAVDPYAGIMRALAHDVDVPLIDFPEVAGSMWRRLEEDGKVPAHVRANGEVLRAEQVEGNPQTAFQVDEAGHPSRLGHLLIAGRIARLLTPGEESPTERPTGLQSGTGPTELFGPRRARAPAATGRPPEPR